MNSVDSKKNAGLDVNGLHFSPEKENIFSKITMTLDRSAIDTCDAFLLGGSFLKKQNFLDIDIMIIYPETKAAVNWLQILVVDDIKVEIFHEFPSSIRNRLELEHRSNVCGLAELINSSRDLVNRTTIRSDLIEYSEKIQLLPRRTMSRSLLATYMHTGLHSLRRTAVQSDRVALVIDILNIYRQVIIYSNKKQAMLT